MSTKKYQSGNEKIVRERKIEKLIKSQIKSLDKFVTNNIKNIIENYMKISNKILIVLRSIEK
jgi:hypothetical protein